jgi:hypothetical protein
MRHARSVSILLVLILGAFVHAWRPAASNAQTTSPAYVRQATAVSLPAGASQAVRATPVVPQASAPMSEGTQMVLMFIGGLLAGTLVIGGGIYLHRRWLAHGW